jgi:cytidine deaminase
MRADPVRPPVISPADVRARAAERALPLDELVLELLPWAQSYASASISKFRVGAIALGRSGALYAGANLEFLGEALSFSVHAEQAAVYNAWIHGEAGVTLIASTAPPCGFCRQFLNELTTASELRILLAGHPPTTLAELLPSGFGPRDLGIDGGLMQATRVALNLAGMGESPAAADDPVAAAALAAASAAYAPYSGTLAGVALRTADGSVFEGRYAENAAFNPSLSPLQGALVALTLAGGSYAAIEDAVLVEGSEPPTGRFPPPASLPPIASQRASTVAVLGAVAPNVRLRYLRAQHSGEEAATVQGPGGLDSTDTSALS